MRKGGVEVMGFDGFGYVRFGGFSKLFGFYLKGNRKFVIKWIRVGGFGERK